MWAQMASAIAWVYVEGRPVFPPDADFPASGLALEAPPLGAADFAAEGLFVAEVETAVVAEPVRLRLFPFGGAGRRAFLDIRGFHQLRTRMLARAMRMRRGERMRRLKSSANTETGSEGLAVPAHVRPGIVGRARCGQMVQRA